MEIPRIVFGSTQRLWMLVIQGLWFFGPAYAQTLVVVQDVKGDALPGASVVLVDDSLKDGVITDYSGQAILPDKWFGSLNQVQVRFSYTGFVAQTKAISKNSNGNTVRLDYASNRLNTFVVTGQYRPEDPRKAVHKVQVIEQETIERMAARNVSEVLANVMNVRLDQDNILGSSISFMGLSGQNVKILIDGVPVIGRLDGNLDLSQMVAAGIERIELVEGPMSVTYGTDALAGTINIITRSSGKRHDLLKVKSYTEHIGRLDLNGRFEHARGNKTWSVDLARNFFAGWNPDQRGLPNLSPQVADSNRFQQWKPRVLVQGRFNYATQLKDWKLNYKGEVMNDLLLNRGLPRAPQYTSAFDETFRTQRLDNVLSAETSNELRRWSVLAAHNRYFRKRNTYFRDLTDLSESIVQGESSNDTTTFYLTNVRATYANTNDSSWFNWEVGLDLNANLGSGQRIEDGNVQRIDDLAAYASGEFELSDGLKLRPGLRYAYNSVYDVPLTPSVNLRWRPSDRLTYRLSYAKGFRSPALKELYLTFVDVNHNLHGNLDLNPETSNSFNLNIAYSPKSAESLSAQLALAYNDVSDMIDLVQVGGPVEFSYHNVGRVRTFASNLSLGLKRAKSQYTFSGGAIGREDNFETGLKSEFFLTPQAAASIAHQLKNDYSLFAQYRFQGTQRSYYQEAGDELGLIQLGEYHLLQLSASKKLCNESLLVSIGVKDLLDTRNINVTQGASMHGLNNGQSALTTGRTVFLTLSWELKKLP